MSSITFNIPFLKEYQKSLYYRMNSNLTPNSFLREKQAHSRIYANLVNSILKQTYSPLIEFTLMKNCSISQYLRQTEIESRVLEADQLSHLTHINDIYLPETNYLMVATDLTDSIARFILAKKQGPQNNLLVLSNYGHKDDPYFKAKVSEQKSFAAEIKRSFPEDEYIIETSFEDAGMLFATSYIRSTDPKQSLTRTYYM